jgi:glycosyltransferase involved in cell wall biosynthesis
MDSKFNMVKKTKVIMVGPYRKENDFRGIMSVLSTYFKDGNFENYKIKYIATSHRGNRILKFILLISSLINFTLDVMFTNTRMVHIHSADFRSMFRKMIYASIAILFKKKVLFHIHGGQFDRFYGQTPIILKNLISRVLDKVDIIIVLSEFWAKYMSTITKNCNIRILYNPVLGSEFVFYSRTYRNDRKNVLYMTMLTADKGIFDLLGAIPIVLEKEPSAKFLFCGEGELEKCRTICKEKAIINNVEFYGWVSGKDKINQFYNAEVFVLPSHFEGLPVSMIEAMFAGLPIVTTPVGGIPDVFEDGVNGFLVPVGDKEAIAESILRLLQNKPLREKMGQHNRHEAYESFDVHSIIAKLLEIYNETLNSKLVKVRC